MKTYILLPILILFSSFTTVTETERKVYEGIAKDKNSNKVIYKEVHNEISKNKEHVVTITNFYDSDDKPIAKRELDFTNSKTMPNYSLIDYRLGASESVSYVNGKFKISFKDDRDSDMIVKYIEVPEPVVVDGGFNYFVKTGWNNLVNGEVLHFNYISTARQDYFRFRLSRVPSNESLQTNEVVFKMEPANYFLRALLDPIFIEYDLNTKRIKNYDGISNIRDITGKNHVAFLYYPTVGP
jgi:hypothetical protein